MAVCVTVNKCYYVTRVGLGKLACKRFPLVSVNNTVVGSCGFTVGYKFCPFDCLTMR